MKIEKISDTQVKFILNHQDLTERNIKIDELVSPTEKTQELFRDIMEQAMEECEFTSANCPLMVEAVPVASDGIMIIVTKLQNNENAENKFTLVSQSKDMRRFKKKSIAPLDNDLKLDGCISVYSFIKLDDVIDVCSRLYGCFHGFNSLYKLQGKYFLILQTDTESDNIDIDDIELILGEYGQKHVSTMLSKYYIVEHGELILRNHAIKALYKSFA